MDNYLLHASGHSSSDQIENQINLFLSHAHLCLVESDDKLDDDSASINTFDLSCGDGGSSSLLLDIAVSVLVTSDVVCC